jgi:hypothetical protein
MRYLGIVATLALVASIPASADPVFTPIKVPGAKSTYASVVNAAGFIAGDYERKDDPCGPNCGFVRAPDGTFTTFAMPRAQFFNVLGINNSATVAGYYYVDNSPKSFIRTPGGTITVVKVHGFSTVIVAINDAGVVTGTVYRNSAHRGFVRTPDGAATVFKVRGCQTTTPSSINAAGTVAGTCGKPGYLSHAFLRTADGTITTFEAPGSGQFGTSAAYIDDAGSVAGSFLDSSLLSRGYIRDADGTFHIFEIPGVNSSGIEVSSIVQVGDDRQVIGSELEPDFHWHGFIRHEAGQVETFDISQGVERYAGTFAFGATSAGVVVGTSTDDNKKYQGYLRTP